MDFDNELFLSSITQIAKDEKIWYDRVGKKILNAMIRNVFWNKWKRGFKELRKIKNVI